MTTAIEHNHHEGVPRLPSEPLDATIRKGDIGHAAFKPRNEAEKKFASMMDFLGFHPAPSHDERKFLKPRKSRVQRKAAS